MLQVRWMVAALFLGWTAVIVVCAAILVGRIDDTVVRTLAIAGLNLLVWGGLAALVFSGDD